MYKFIINFKVLKGRKFYLDQNVYRYGIVEYLRIFIYKGGIMLYFKIQKYLDNYYEVFRDINFNIKILISICLDFIQVICDILNE